MAQTVKDRLLDVVSTVLGEPAPKDIEHESHYDAKGDEEIRLEALEGITILASSAYMVYRLEKVAIPLLTEWLPGRSGFRWLTAPHEYTEDALDYLLSQIVGELDIDVYGQKAARRLLYAGTLGGVCRNITRRALDHVVHEFIFDDE